MTRNVPHAGAGAPRVQKGGRAASWLVARGAASAEPSSARRADARGPWGVYFPATMTFNRMGTVPLPLALHLATHTVIGLFCAFAGGLNLIDPTKIFPNGAVFLAIAVFSWGYVFGILMARKEVVALGLVASLAYVAAGVWQLGADWRLGALLAAVGVYGLATLALYRRRILEA